MTADDIREALRQKIAQGWSDYKTNILWRPSSEVFDCAGEIAAARFCYEQLTENLNGYPAEYLEYLLRFEDPLPVVQEQWASEQDVDHGEEFEHALWTLLSTRDAEYNYPLDPDWPAEQHGPTMC